MCSGVGSSKREGLPDSWSMCHMLYVEENTTPGRRHGSSCVKISLSSKRQASRCDLQETGGMRHRQETSIRTKARTNRLCTQISRHNNVLVKDDDDAPLPLRAIIGACRPSTGETYTVNNHVFLFEHLYPGNERFASTVGFPFTLVQTTAYVRYTPQP